MRDMSVAFTENAPQLYRMQVKGLDRKPRLFDGNAEQGCFEREYGGFVTHDHISFGETTLDALTPL